MLSTAACARPDDPGPDRAQALNAHDVPRSARVDSMALAALRARYPGVRVHEGNGETVPGTNERAGWFRYDTPENENAYGAIIAVWSAEAGVLVWTRQHPGDFPPHGLVWLDADGDGRTDLFFTAGEETVLETHLFTRRAGKTASVESAFARAYVNDSAYVPLVDLDRDGTPELIEPTTVDEAGEMGPCIETPVPPAVHRAAADEYARIALPFDAANVRFSDSAFAFGTLHVRHPIRVLQVREGRARDATADFREHLHWRAALLSRYRDASTDRCRAELDGVLQDLGRD